MGKTQRAGAVISTTYCRRAQRYAGLSITLPYMEMPAFMAELRKREGIAALALEFLILTAARTGEIVGACWDEFDLDSGVWTVPGERMKARREHRVPLSAHAIEILQARPADAPPFPLSS